MLARHRSSFAYLNWIRQFCLIACALLIGVLAHAQVQVINLLGAHGKYVVAESDQVTVNANRPAAGPWEQWQMTRNGNMVTFKSYWGKFLSAQPDGSMQANRTAIGAWEQFQLIDAGSGNVAFRTAHGKYLVSEPSGAFLGNRTAIGPWEQFRVAALSTTTQTGSAASTTPPATTTAAAPAAQQAAVDEPTEFYWRGSYGRGVGTPLDACPAGKQQRGALCYDTCRDGYSDHGTLTCSTNCPSGYTDMGAICHYNGTKSYSPVHWDNCKSRAPRWLGRGCIGGFVEDSCRSGFKKVASVCWADLSVPPGMSGSAWDPAKGTYNLTPVPMVCSGGKEQDAGLCYTPCRSGYNGVGPVCWASKPSGFVDCGLGYATDSSTCGFLIADQVMGVISLVKDACSLTQFPGVSQACALGGSKYMQAKALAKLKVKSVAEFASNTALAAKTAERAQNMMAAIQKAQPVIDRLRSGVKGPVQALSGKGVTALAEFGESMAKVGDSLKDPDTLATLYGVVQTIRGAAGDPPYKPSGTQTEQAFKAIRDISSYYGLTVSLLSLTYPGFEASPVGEGMMATADVMGTVAAYLYTVKGQ